MTTNTISADILRNKISEMKNRISEYTKQSLTLKADAREKLRQAEQIDQHAAVLQGCVMEFESLLGPDEDEAYQGVFAGLGGALFGNSRPESPVIRYRKPGPTVDILKMVIEKPGIEEKAVMLAMKQKGVKADTVQKAFDRMIENDDVRSEGGKLTITDTGMAAWKKSPLSLTIEDL